MYEWGQGENKDKAGEFGNEQVESNNESECGDSIHSIEDKGNEQRALSRGECCREENSHFL
jgi:hypothetical protein